MSRNPSLLKRFITDTPTDDAAATLLLPARKEPEMVDA
jgi:hypothetical protein